VGGGRIAVMGRGEEMDEREARKERKESGERREKGTAGNGWKRV